MGVLLLEDRPEVSLNELVLFGGIGARLLRLDFFDDDEGELVRLAGGGGSGGSGLSGMGTGLRDNGGVEAETKQDILILSFGFSKRIPYNFPFFISKLLLLTLPVIL